MAEPYTSRTRSARLGARVLAGAGMLILLAAPVADAGPAREIKADGRWHKFEIRAPEQILPYLFEVRSGCRYRLSVACADLKRALVEVGPGASALFSADTRPPDMPTPTTAPPPDRPEAQVTWYAQTEGVFEARVRGFSALTGRGRIRLETLGPDGERVGPHRRLLAPGGTLAQVGSLWVGDSDRWELVVRPGRKYEISSQPGTAGRIALAVIGPGDQVVAEAAPTVAAPYPRLRFAPLPVADAKAPPPAYFLEVRAVDGGGGTYGVRIYADPRPAPDADPSGETPPPVVTGPVEGVPLAFNANPGDLALLYLPRSSPYDPHWIQKKSEAKWVTLPHDGLSLHGERASMRTPEKAAIVWFKPFVPGTYRFYERRAKNGVLRVLPADEVPDAPLLLGTGHDPTVSARGTATWRAIGVGVCMPGWDYLFVAVGRRRASVSMRIRYSPAPGEPYRVRRGLGGTRVAGLGPSLRFRVKAATLVHLEVKGRGWRGYALLRRAGN